MALIYFLNVYGPCSPALKNISADAKELLKAMLTVDPVKRITASDALKHRWVTGASHTDKHQEHLEETTASFRMSHANRKHR